MKDLGSSSVMPKSAKGKSEKWYHSVDVKAKDFPELSGVKLGSTIDAEMRLKLVRISEDSDGKRYGLEMRKMDVSDEENDFIEEATKKRR